MENGVDGIGTTDTLPKTAKSEFLVLAVLINHDLSEILWNKSNSEMEFKK